MNDVRLSLCALVLAAVGVHGQGIQTTGANDPKARLSVEDVVKLTQTGLSEELIVTKIKKNAKAFDLSTDEILELKNLGVNETVIKFLLDPSQPYTPPVAPPAAILNPADPRGTSPLKVAPSKEYPVDAYATKIPPEPGLYGVAEQGILKVDIKMLLGAKQSAGMGKLLMKKGKAIAYIVGANAKIRYPTPEPTLYMRLPEGKGIEEVVLLAFERKGQRREIAMGPIGPKPELDVDVMKPFDALEIAARLYRISTGRLPPGEYLFFLVGSAEAPQGIFGKGYDFGIDTMPK